MKTEKQLDIIIPVSMELDWPTREDILSCIREQHEKWGFSRFALAAPCGGWRSVGYPPRERFRELASLFADIRDTLRPEGISCGWWDTLTLKSGPSEEFTRITRSDGSVSPMGNCPLDPAFRKRFSEDIALFASIGKPDFIIFEDDYSVNASSDGMGCFCKHHLAEFSRREGTEYTRETLAKRLRENDEEAVALNRRFRALTRDSLVGLSERVRREVDRETPEVPIGYMQSGGCDLDGEDTTEAVCRALAGPRHVPFSRLFGTAYNGMNSKSLTEYLFHPICSRQHIRGEFRFYHESDTFPHTRFYMSGKQMLAMMGYIYSYGFDGSTFQTQQLLDDPNEETAYGEMFARERARLGALNRTAWQCEQKGVHLPYDVFYNNFRGSCLPGWLRAVSSFGIPFSTLPGNVAFWDYRTAHWADRETVLKALSGGLFLDGSAAKELVSRGFGEYLGVTLGENAAPQPLGLDLGAREVILPPFDTFSRGKNMPSAFMFSAGCGTLYRMTVTDPACEVISELETFRREPVCPAMTRFKNSLGGRIVVYGTTLEGNRSQSLFNYRRQRLMQELLCWCSDEYAFVKNAADIAVVMNRAKDPAEAGFLGMLTLVSLCEDTFDTVSLHLPPEWRNTEVQLLEIDGTWQAADCRKTADGVELLCPLEHLAPMAVRFLRER